MTVQYLPQPRPMSPERLTAMRAQLELFVATEPQPVKRRRWRRRTYVGGIGALVLVGVSGGTALAIALLHSKPVTDFSVARCYSVAAYSPGQTFRGTTVATGSTSRNTPGLIEHALETCSAAWEAGILQPGVPNAVPAPAKSAYPVPALVGCTLPNGIAAVFPGPPQTCQRLHLAPQNPAAIQSAVPLPSST